MTKWIKPSGIEIELNDLPATIKAAEGLEWVREGDNKGPKKETKAQLIERAKTDFNVTLDPTVKVDALKAAISDIEEIGIDAVELHDCATVIESEE